MFVPCLLNSKNYHLLACSSLYQAFALVLTARNTFIPQMPPHLLSPCLLKLFMHTSLPQMFYCPWSVSTRDSSIAFIITHWDHMPVKVGRNENMPTVVYLVVRCLYTYRLHISREHKSTLKTWQIALYSYQEFKEEILKLGAREIWLSSLWSISVF